MMTQLEAAKQHIVTPLMERIAGDEKVTVESLRSGLASGVIVIPRNKTRRLTQPCGIGKGLRTKVNANLGTSTDKEDIGQELKKLATAVSYGADAVMDLSVGGNLASIRAAILSHSPVPVGTVPVYEIAVNSQQKRRDPLAFDHKDMLKVLEAQARQGVDFFTIHSGVTKANAAALVRQKRLMGIVSRGGALIAAWMRRHRKENPFFAYFDEILQIAREYDVCLSLGDGLRPGSIFDATDAPQIAELKTLGELAQRCRKAGVQAMIEGPGHVPLDEVEKNIRLQKRLCKGAPFYVLGPLVTDVAAGYDHITSAIGGAIAAAAGADFLCYVTPAEHLRLPSIDDVKEGVVASRIAAHAGDIVKFPHAREWDRQMSLARRKRDWKRQIALSIDPVKAKEYRGSSKPKMSDVCTMCGKFCSMKLMEETVGCA